MLTTLLLAHPDLKTQRHLCHKYIFFFFPSSVHIYITPMHTQDGIKERFVNDLSCVTDELLRQPRTKMEGRVNNRQSNL